jgi:TRAP-type C4-dicarboxylate transport system permease small subunit
MAKILEGLTSLEKMIASILIFLLTTLVVIDVGAREIFRTGLPWAQKGAVYMMIWAGFIGAIIVCHKVEHLRPEVADKFWKGKARSFYLRSHNLLVFAFTATMTFYSCKYVLESREFGDRNIIIDMPMWFLQAVIPYSFFSMSLRYFYFIIFPKEKDPEAVH